MTTQKQVNMMTNILFLLAAVLIGTCAFLRGQLVAWAAEDAAQPAKVQVRYVGEVVERKQIITAAKYGAALTVVAADEAAKQQAQTAVTAGSVASAATKPQDGFVQVATSAALAAHVVEEPWLHTNQELPETKILGGEPTTASESDVAALARIIWWEARGDSAEGKMAVGQVVLNRVNSPQFPNTIQKVISQKSQFSPYENSSYFDVSISEDCYEAAAAVLSGAYYLPEDVLWFRSDVKKEKWRTMLYYDTIGEHYFYIAD